MIELTSETFERFVIDGSHDVLVRFYAKYSDHECEKTDAAWSAFLSSMGSRATGPRPLRLAQIDIDAHHVIASHLEVEQIPILMLFPVGASEPIVVPSDGITAKSIETIVEAHTSAIPVVSALNDASLDEL